MNTPKKAIQYKSISTNKTSFLLVLSEEENYIQGYNIFTDDDLPSSALLDAPGFLLFFHYYL